MLIRATKFLGSAESVCISYRMDLWPAGLEWPPRKFAEVMQRLLGQLGVPAFTRRYPALADSVLFQMLGFIQVRFSCTKHRLGQWLDL